MDVDLIKVVNRLQETFTTIGGHSVDLPQCVVVGSQSSGKSSVLETIVGRDFLPRGNGIVTRRPLVLQLIHLSPGTDCEQTEEYGEFLHLDRRFFDFDSIRSEVESETYRVAGQNKGISKQPIHLKIYSPNVINLTLVDLPGLTKIPVGDQPSDIERQIRSLVTDYISKPNCIIMAVSPANVDLANSDSLKLARAVDPQGRRTIGVLTKLDLMDNGTNALDILTGRVYPLKLGFIGVVNRSQQDINSNVPLGEARRAEEEFFHSHLAYRNIAHRCGTKYLAKTLNHVLMNHIRERLPDMKARLNTLMGQAHQELLSFGDATFMGDQHRGTLILKLMTQFARDFVASIDGTAFDISTKELCGGARVYYIFQDVFGHALNSVNPTQNLTVQDIRTAIRNSTGPRPSLFVPEAAFELLVKPQIRLFEPPSLRCVELVYEELMKICHNCSGKELQRFPRLQALLIEVVSDLLRERLGPTSEYVKSLIDIQAAYINTSHPAFVQDSANIATRVRNAQPSKVAEHVKREAALDSDLSGAASEDLADERNKKGVTANGTARSYAPKHRTTEGAVCRPRAEHTTQPEEIGPAGQRESFLNYFFGGSASMPIHEPNGSATGFGVRSAPEPKPNLMAGRVGLEGSSAAFDMKSLDQYLEADPVDDEVQLSEREALEVNLIRQLITSYFSIVRQSIQDLVPKAVMHLLVNFSRETIQNRLVINLYKESLFEHLLHEDEALTRERKRIQTLLDAYKEGFNALSDIGFPPSRS
ncbi:dynamin GTPase [Malassezia vespertilionis]|uniref:Dnm1p n=1 Tax=Malassezia vespertilionis TaxID=2020962 RepID=A0A2N1JE13_9BASI|nr:dynamin GTPase [Malassezia vespertilionis]PKI84774.1 Dnm1p [Malassezia vespertilionis]WFD05573.1 dynamin GTPase [Malassezia vespertilionis]